jgi:hypothetical protein
VGRNVLERSRPDLDERPGRVRDQDVAVSVDDRAARRLQPERADLIVAGILEVALTGDDLKRPEAEEERAEDRDRDDPENRDADGRLRRDAVRLLDPRVGREEAGGQAGAGVGDARQRG